MLKYLTAGESHGKALAVILEGMPHGIKINEQRINLQLKRRQMGYGRGKRMAIESDRVKILSGIRNGYTTAAPIALLIENKDKSLNRLPPITCPRPGHADLAGMLKYNIYDARDILERSSARETAARVAVGGICRQFLGVFKIKISSSVKSIAGVNAVGKKSERFIKKLIDRARDEKDTLGGIFEIIALGLPPGLGSCMRYDKKLDARLGLELFSIQAIKAVAFGAGFEAATLKGSQFHDEIYYRSGHFARKTNNAGGIEGGMTNGEPLRISCIMKPISTLMQPLDSVNAKTKKSAKAAVARADVCAVPAAAVVAENVTAITLANAFLEKFGTDSLEEIIRNYEGYLEQLRKF